MGLEVTDMATMFSEYVQKPIFVLFVRCGLGLVEVREDLWPVVALVIDGDVHVGREEGIPGATDLDAAEEVSWS